MPHSDTLARRWAGFSLAEQLGNIGSEYERALANKNKGAAARFQNASDRLLELLDLTLSDPRWRDRRLVELARLREQVCEELFALNPANQPTLQKYFYYFALEARSKNQ